MPIVQLAATAPWRPEWRRYPKPSSKTGSSSSSSGRSSSSVCSVSVRRVRIRNPSKRSLLCSPSTKRNVAIQRKVEASAGVEFFGALDATEPSRSNGLNRSSPVSRCLRNPANCRRTLLGGRASDCSAAARRRSATRQRSRLCSDRTSDTAPEPLKVSVIGIVEQRRAGDDARRQARAVLQDDVDRCRQCPGCPGRRSASG